MILPFNHGACCAIPTTILLLATASVPAQGLRSRESGPDKAEPTRAQVSAAIDAGHNELALSLLTKLVLTHPKDLTLLRARMTLLLSLQLNLTAMESARQLLEALPSGLEKTALRPFADLSHTFFEKMASAEIVARLQILKEQGAPERMALLIKILETRINNKSESGKKIVAEFYGSDNKFFDRDKAVTHFNLYLNSIQGLGSMAQQERVAVYKSLLALEKGDKLRQVVVSTARSMAQERTTAAFQDLSERAVLYRVERDPGKLLEVLTQLEKIRPEDPTIHFGLGEVYGSAGTQFSSSKAIASFRKFLDLTTDESFEVDAFGKAFYSKSDLATSLRGLASLDQGDDIQKIRLRVHHYLELLQKRQRLLLVTPARIITRMLSRKEKDLENRNKTIEKAKADILGCESYIQRMRGSHHDYRRTHIAAKKQQIRHLQEKIARDEKKVQLLTEELARLQQASR